MYWFGKEADRPWEVEQNWSDLRALKQRFAQTSTEDIIALLDSFSREDFSEALPHVKDAETLGLLPDLLSRQSLEKRLKAEFAPIEILDRFAKAPSSSVRIRALPLGIVLHVTAGNVFLSSIDSLIMGLLTKNLNIVKVSSQNTYFPLFFARKLAAFDKDMIVADKFAVLHWKGGDEQVESVFKHRVNGIIAWGGDEMMASLGKDLPPQVKLLGFGPKVSFQVLSVAGLTDYPATAKKIVADVVRWNQAACSSPQNLFIQAGIDKKQLLIELENAFRNAAARGSIDSDEAVEILKEKYRGLYSELMEGGKVSEGEDFLLHLEKSPVLKPSPLNRTLIIKEFSTVAELAAGLEPLSYYLQSCGYLLSNSEKETFLTQLGLAGVKRFAPIGTLTWGMEGAPHDGKNVLRELTLMIGDEARVTEVSGPLLSGSDMKNYFHNHPAGYIFSSGGTTGEPKYVHFSTEEFDQITDMLAQNFKAQGITRGMTVANLFVAGNLWSSFLAVDKALEKIGVVQLPIGGLCTVENIVRYLGKFRPEIVVGIPSLLIQYAEYASTNNIKISVPKVFYAGEGLSPSRRQYFRKVWETEFFGSAGYASVDAGVIAYQCKDCGPGEHHLFSDLVSMRIVDGEAVVTSLYRNTMPIVNYRTGDRVEWIEENKCQFTDRKFRLLGRIDNMILIWSCRVDLSVIENAVSERLPDCKTWQVVISENESEEIMTLVLETPEEDLSDIIPIIFENSRDLKDTLSYEFFKKYFHVECREVARNERTGKVSLIKDQRFHP